MMKIEKAYATCGDTCTVCTRVIREGRMYLRCGKTSSGRERFVHVACIQRLIDEAPPDYSDDRVIEEQFIALAERARSGVDLFA